MDQPLFSKSIHDWRHADSSTDDLTTLQKAPWQLAVTDGAYGGIVIEATDPTGKTHRVSLEVDLGCLTAVISLDQDSDPVAKLTLGENAVFVAPTHSAPGDPPSDLALTSGESTWHHALPGPRLT